MTPCKAPSSNLLRFAVGPPSAGLFCSATVSGSDDLRRFAFVTLSAKSDSPPSGGSGWDRRSGGMQLTRAASVGCMRFASTAGTPMLASRLPRGSPSAERGRFLVIPGSSASLNTFPTSEKSVLSNCSSSHMDHTSSSATGVPHSFNSSAEASLSTAILGGGRLYAYSFPGQGQYFFLGEKRAPSRTRNPNVCFPLLHRLPFALLIPR